MGMNINLVKNLNNDCDDVLERLNKLQTQFESKNKPDSTTIEQFTSKADLRINLNRVQKEYSVDSSNENPMKSNDADQIQSNESINFSNKSHSLSVNIDDNDLDLNKEDREVLYSKTGSSEFINYVRYSPDRKETRSINDYSLKNFNTINNNTDIKNINIDNINKKLNSDNLDVNFNNK